MAPFDPQARNSAWLANRPMVGLQVSVLSQTATPRRTQPPAWITSVTMLSWRQSAKTQIGAPGFAMRWHSPSQSDHQYPKERWSRLSRANSGRTTWVPFFTYFSDGSLSRSDRYIPPLEYGGSVISASTHASGRPRRTARQSPADTCQRLEPL